MTDPRYELRLNAVSKEVLDELSWRDKQKLKRVNKALSLLAKDPRYPGLQAHKYRGLEGKGPSGADIWTAYVENRTPAAWRIFFAYAADADDVIYILAVGPHP